MRKKDTHKIYAMKTLRKSALLKRNQIAHTKTERNILQNFNHPFLVELHFGFQTKEKLYLVLDFMSGGELFFWLKAQKRFSEPRAKLYAAEIYLALSFLHKHDIVYRDLKPENILVDGDGHLRVTDFGLSKDGVSGAGKEGGTGTFCGTPEYLAPEILANKGHGKAVDWWSFGTLVFEMLKGLPPFYDQNMQRMYDKILHMELILLTTFRMRQKSYAQRCSFERSKIALDRRTTRILRTTHSSRNSARRSLTGILSCQRDTRPSSSRQIALDHSMSVILTPNSPLKTPKTRTRLL